MACMNDTCAVCGAEIDAENPPAVSNFQGQQYCCCCDECKAQFDSNPQMYARQQAA